MRLPCYCLNFLWALFIFILFDIDANSKAEPISWIEHYRKLKLKCFVAYSTLYVVACTSLTEQQSTSRYEACTTVLKPIGDRCLAHVNRMDLICNISSASVLYQILGLHLKELRCGVAYARRKVLVIILEDVCSLCYTHNMEKKDGSERWDNKQMSLKWVTSLCETTLLIIRPLNMVNGDDNQGSPECEMIYICDGFLTLKLGLFFPFRFTFNFYSVWQLQTVLLSAMLPRMLIVRANLSTLLICLNTVILLLIFQTSR